MYKRLRIQDIKEEIEGFKTFAFSQEPGREIRYQAGQYLTLLHPDHPEEIRRSYSIVSSPALNEPLTIGLKRIDNGLFSRYLNDEAKIDDEILTIGAAGFFTLPEDLPAYEQVYFLAAGSGITPIFSLLKTMLATNPHLQATLIYSNNSVEKAGFKNELDQLAEMYPDKFRIEYIFSTDPDLMRAHLHRELLVYFLRKFAVTTPEKMLAFTCGPENYMRMCIYGFRFVNIPPENIRKEIFNINKAVPKVEPPDKEQHLVTFLTGKDKFEIPVQFPVTILNAAKKQGLQLPYSCEAGRCGNCVANCLEGKVWMSYNEVLTTRDLEKGLILTCVAYPVFGNVTIAL